MIHIATYIDVEPSSTSQAISVVKRYRDKTRAEDGNTIVILLQETFRPNRFVMIESWNSDNDFQAHDGAAHTSECRAAVAAIHNSPSDQRVHHSFALGPQPDSNGGLYVVTHVDVPPPRREETEVLLTVQAAQSRNDQDNVQYDVFQQNAPRTNHFTVLAAWKDETAFVSHQAAQHTRRYREGLGPMLGAPYDERLYKLV